MVAQVKVKTYSPKEYLALEETAEFRNEYIDGEIVPMTGGTTIHNQIAGNFYKAFPLTIDAQDYYTYINGLFRHRYGKEIPSRRIWSEKAMLARREVLCI